MHFSKLTRIAHFLGFLSVLFPFANSTSQIVIREKIQITPTSPKQVAVETQTGRVKHIRIEFSWDEPILGRMYLTGPCVPYETIGYSPLVVDAVLISTIEFNLQVRTAELPVGGSTNAEFKVFIDDTQVRSESITLSGGFIFQVWRPEPLYFEENRYSTFNIFAEQEFIYPQEYATFSLEPILDCTERVWNLTDPITLRTVQGSEWGAFFTTDDQFLGYEFTLSSQDFQFIKFVPDPGAGIQQEVTVVVEATSGQTVAQTSFQIRPEQLQFRITARPQDMYYGKKASFTVETRRQTGELAAPKSTTRYTFRITEGAEWGFLSRGTLEADSISGIRPSSFLPFWAGEAGVTFHAWENNPTTLQTVKISIESNDDSIMPDSVVFPVGPERLRVNGVPLQLSYGDTAAVKIAGKWMDTTLVPISTQSDKYYELVKGSGAGNLLPPNGNPPWDFVFGKFDSLAFVAVEETPQPEILPVWIWTVVDESPTSRLEAITKLDVVKLQLDHFTVTAEEDTIAFGETTTILVQAKDANDNDVELPPDSKINIVLRADERFGNLAYGTEIGKAFVDIPYLDAKDGKILFAATEENPAGLEPQKVDIGVTGLSKEGTGSVWVKSNFVKYCQTDSAWANEPYDSYKQLDNKGNVVEPERHYTVREKGCALTAMAMVLRAVGLNYDPKVLNEEIVLVQRQMDTGGMS